MKTVKNKNSKKPLIIVLIAVGVIIIAFILLAIFFHPNQKVNSPTGSKTDSTTTSNTDAKSQAQSSATPAVDSGKTTDQIPVNPTATATITQLEQASNGDILFNATITGADQNGQCSVTFTTPNDKPYAPDAFAGTAQGSSTICGPLKISNLNFSSLGTWTATLRYYVGAQQVTTSSKIDIEQ